MISMFVDLLLVALVTTYIVDLSGFTDSWRSALARRMRIPESNLRPIKPFDCSLCMTWWVCLIYGTINWGFTLALVAYSALLSFLSLPMGQAMLFIRESILWLIDKLMPR